ncbi:MAG TPA: nucleotidyltransferase family protein [Spirochaetota bacterium]|nr:nucleotidyltransferase family protein [Spirochaetota bacterium]HQP49085.1 nucleotidyltransferase family protein [Spirochaetota bacterium]
MVPSRDKVLQIIKTHRSYLQTEYGVEKIGLFGSIATDTADADSDIDLVVQFNKPIGFRFYELVEYLEKLFNRKVDVLTPDGIESIRNNTISSNIKRITLYI